jgi:hypothetical protein
LITSLTWLVIYHKAAWLERIIKLQANQAKRLIRLACWEVWEEATQAAPAEDAGMVSREATSSDLRAYEEA